MKTTKLITLDNLSDDFSIDEINKKINVKKNILSNTYTVKWDEELRAEEEDLFIPFPDGVGTGTYSFQIIFDALYGDVDVLGASITMPFRLPLVNGLYDFTPSGDVKEDYLTELDNAGTLLVNQSGFIIRAGSGNLKDIYRLTVTAEEMIMGPVLTATPAAKPQ